MKKLHWIPKTALLTALLGAPALAWAAESGALTAIASFFPCPCC